MSCRTSVDDDPPRRSCRGASLPRGYTAPLDVKRAPESRVHRQWQLVSRAGHWVGGWRYLQDDPYMYPSITPHLMYMNCRGSAATWIAAQNCLRRDIFHDQISLYVYDEMIQGPEKSELEEACQVSPPPPHPTKATPPPPPPPRALRRLHRRRHHRRRRYRRRRRRCVHHRDQRHSP